ncbi:MAG: exodeoxyribonuclease III [Candidatus Zixiibacteriota bacterium]|jgi:exodeoxyribonuclease-3
MARIRILSWNVNGLRAAHKKGLLDWLQRERPDVLCLQETKATAEQLPAELKEVKGYQAHFNAAERKGYSGVAVYTRVEPKEVRDGFGVKRFDVEGRTLVLDYGDFVLFNVYFPNGKASEERLRYKMSFYRAFLKHVSALKDEGRNVVICGDVNTAHKEIDLAHPKQNEKISGFLPQERAWIDKLIGRGFVDTFREFHDEAEQYTWWDMRTRARERNVGWRLDYFFVNEEFVPSVKDAFILPDVMGSDHCPVGVEVKL